MLLDSDKCLQMSYGKEHHYICQHGQIRIILVIKIVVKV